MKGFNTDADFTCFKKGGSRMKLIDFKSFYAYFCVASFLATSMSSGISNGLLKNAVAPEPLMAGSSCEKSLEVSKRMGGAEGSWLMVLAT